MKRNEGMSLYTLVMMPDDRIIECVKECKGWAREILGMRYGSENSLAHITLFAFFAYDNDYLILLRELRRILAGAKPFKVQFNGFESFKEGESCTFFVRLTSDAEKTTIEIRSFLETSFDKRLRKEKTADWKKIGRPHMTVVRNVSFSDVEKCENAFKGKTFNESFDCSSLALRKLNIARGQYDIVDIIPLLGNKYIVGQQTKVFEDL